MTKLMIIRILKIPTFHPIILLLIIITVWQYHMTVTSVLSSVVIFFASDVIFGIISQKNIVPFKRKNSRILFLTSRSRCIATLTIIIIIIGLVLFIYL